jgi:nicotinamidase-related amidase
MFAKGQEIKGDTALLIIDIQYFYYPGGKIELVNPEQAGKNAKKLLEHFRKNKMLVVHVRHNSEPGVNIHEDVKPLANEKVISKDNVNCFKRTDLLEYLKANNIKQLIICGMQTHMCVEAATRAASDLDFDCTVISDACATRNLKFGDKEIKADDVHYSTLSTLKSYAKVTDTKTYLNEK